MGAASWDEHMTNLQAETPTAPADSPEIACKVFRKGKDVGSPQHLHEISEILKEPDTFVWFDAVDPGPSGLDLLKEEFNLHPLAIEDAIQAHQRPKIEPYDGYWFVVVLAASLEESERIVLHEIAVFVGKKFLVTVRHAPAFPLDEIERRWHAHPERLRRGGGFLLYTILDTVVDGYFPIMERLGDRVDLLEQTLFEARTLHGDILRHIFVMRRDAQEFRKAAFPMRDILNPILRKDVSLFPNEEVVYFRDVYDHAVRVIDELDTLRDLLSSALEIHLSVVGNQQNEVAKQLTIIATVFLPLSFIVGFFGQNFGVMVQFIGSAPAFWLLGIGLEVVCVAVMMYYFKRRGWF